ncbi:hypothetical protein K1719_018418 [Acacia pycnantha]|nr:hypothetical protein K1719_018418 [Acacia pycnantha]
MITPCSPSRACSGTMALFGTPGSAVPQRDCCYCPQRTCRGLNSPSLLHIVQIPGTLSTTTGWKEFAEVYKSALLYLAYTSVESLSDSFKLDLAFDLCLSALLGDNIYNFGELLAHPIINSLLGTKVEWLYYILQAFNSGDLVRYQELCRVHNAALKKNLLAGHLLHHIDN